MRPADETIFFTVAANPCEGCKHFEQVTPIEDRGFAAFGQCLLKKPKPPFFLPIPVYAHRLPPCLVWRKEP